MNFTKSPKRKIILSIALVVLLAVGIIVVSVLRAQGGKSPATRNIGKPAVEGYVVARKDLIRTIVLTGQTVPEAQIDISAKYAGRITQVNAELGQAVTAGQLLIVQDTGDIDISIAQNNASRRQAEADTVESRSTYEANYLKAKADYQRSLTSYQRYKELFATGAVSRETLDSIEQQMINAKSALDTMENQIMTGATAAAVESKRAALVRVDRNIEALEKQRDDLMLRAPRSGVIGYRQVEAGALVQPGQKLMTVVDNSHIFIDCQLSEQYIAHLQIGKPVKIQIESLGRVFDGKIIYISPANDAKNLTFMVRIALDSLDPAVKAGMFARTEIQVLQRPMTLAVPKDAVLQKNGQYLLYVINGNNQVEERKVKIGLRNDSEIEILEGLQEGEQVAISNLARLKTGLAVTVEGEGNQPKVPRGGRK